jgi:hypothetical protein
MIGNIVILPDERFQKDLPADKDLSTGQVHASEASDSVIIAPGKSQCNYRCFKSDVIQMIIDQLWRKHIPGNPKLHDELVQCL